LEKLGAGTLVLGGEQAYTGDTLITQGILRLGASERINNASRLVLAGGTLDVNGHSEILGALLLSGNSVVDLDNSSLLSGSIAFADSSLLGWSGFSLSISGSNFGSTSVRFGTDALGLTPTQLSSITVNGQPGWMLDSQGYLTVIPEPASIALLGGLAALIGVGLRRRRS
jgi:fibronectin-binding autotransporter adhesin